MAMFGSPRIKINSKINYFTDIGIKIIINFIINNYKIIIIISLSLNKWEASFGNKFEWNLLIDMILIWIY